MEDITLVTMMLQCLDEQDKQIAQQEDAITKLADEVSELLAMCRPNPGG